jgi:hypothetical protein
LGKKFEWEYQKRKGGAVSGGSGSGHKGRIHDLEPARALAKTKGEGEDHTITSGGRNQMVPKGKDQGSA